MLLQEKAISIHSFEDLFKNVKQIQNRVATAQARVHSLASDLPKAEEATLNLTER